MAALHNLYDFLDEFNEIFGEKAEYEITHQNQSLIMNEPWTTRSKLNIFAP